MDDLSPTDVAFLHRTGWSIGDTAFTTATGTTWLVSGSNGENLISRPRPPQKPRRGSGRSRRARELRDDRPGAGSSRPLMN